MYRVFLRAGAYTRICNRWNREVESLQSLQALASAQHKPLTCTFSGGTEEGPNEEGLNGFSVPRGGRRRKGVHVVGSHSRPVLAGRPSMPGSVPPTPALEPL